MVGHFAFRRRLGQATLLLLFLSAGGCFIDEVRSDRPENWPCESDDDCHITRQCVENLCAPIEYSFKVNATFDGDAPTSQNVPNAMILCVRPLGKDALGDTEQIVCTQGVCAPTQQSSYYEGDYLVYMGATGYEVSSAQVTARDLGSANAEPCDEENVCVITLNLPRCQDPSCNPATNLSCDALQPDQTP